MRQNGDRLDQRWPTGGQRAGSGPRLNLLRPWPSLRFIFKKSELHNVMAYNSVLIGRYTSL
jgi:hypothetical protein